MTASPVGTSSNSDTIIIIGPTGYKSERLIKVKDLSAFCIQIYVSIPFFPVTHKVTFQVANVPANSINSIGVWGVSVGGTSVSTNKTNSTSMNLADGNYTYNVAPPINYSSAPRSGNFVVKGNDITILLNFSKVSTNKKLGSWIINVGKNPVAELFDNSTCLLYVANYGSDSVSVIDGFVNLGNLTVGSEPDALSLDTYRDWVYAADYGSDGLSVINVSTVDATLSIGGAPTALAYDSGNHYTYAALKSGSSNYAVVDGLKVLTGGSSSPVKISNSTSIKIIDNPCTNGEYIIGNYTIVYYNYITYFAPTVTLTGPSSGRSLPGQELNLTSKINNGLGPFSETLEYINGTVIQSINNLMQGTTAFNAFIPATGTDSFKVVATDYGLASPYPFNSTILTIAVANAPTAKPVYALGNDNAGNAELFVINASTNLVTSKITFTNNVPAAMVISPDLSTLYVATDLGTNSILTSNTGKIRVINTTTSTVTKVISNIGKVPDSLAISPDGNYVYVGDNTTGRIAVVNTATGGKSNRWFTTKLPKYMVASPSYLYITTSDAKTKQSKIFVLNAGSNSVATTIQLGNSTVPSSLPPTIAITPSYASIYVGTSSPGRIYVVNTGTNKITKIINYTTGFPESIAVTPNGKYAYAANNGNTVSIINTTTNKITSTISVPNATSLDSITISFDGSYAYVGDEYNGKIFAINTATNNVIATISTGANTLLSLST